MVKVKPVDMKWQTIYALIPYVSVWAFYRIQKLKLGILLAVGVGFFTIILMSAIVYSIDFGFSENDAQILITIFMLIYTPTELFTFKFIRKWSKQWNEQF